MGIEKTKLLLCDSIYWIGMNVDIYNHKKNLFYMPQISANTTEGKNNHEIPGKPWEVIGPDMFTLNNKNSL